MDWTKACSKASSAISRRHSRLTPSEPERQGNPPVSATFGNNADSADNVTGLFPKCTFQNTLKNRIRRASDFPLRTLFAQWYDSPNVSQIRHMDKGFAGPFSTVAPSGTPNRVVFLVIGFSKNVVNQTFHPFRPKKQPSGWME